MENTKIWQLYEAGKNYNSSLEPDYYDVLELGINYVEGNHWIGMEDVEFPKATFNFEKRFVNLVTSILSAAKVAISIEPYSISAGDDIKETASITESAVKSFFEMNNFDAFKRARVRDAAVLGDVSAHYLFDPEKKTQLGAVGEIMMEKVYGYNFFPGNTTNNEMTKEVQPYILVVGRDFVKNLQEEAKSYGKSDAKIFPDDADERGRLENYYENSATGYEMATYVYKYEFDGDELVCSKSTQNCDIFEDQRMEMNRYPVPFLLWEEQYNQFHGRSYVADIHHVQNYINRQFALLMYWTMSVAYGKPIYNGDYIPGGWSTGLGEAIEVRGLEPGMRLTDVATNWKPASISGFIVETIELALQYMKEALGISDALLGNVNPENKGAIVVASKNTQAPLENQKERIRQWVEQQVYVVIEMMAAKYGVRDVLVRTEEGNELVEFDFDRLKDVSLNVKVEIGDASYFNEIAVTQTLDNMLGNEVIDVLQYLERLPDIIPDKEGLIKDFKQRTQGMGNAEALSEEELAKMEEFFMSLPEEKQAEIAALPSEQQADAVRALMQ